MSDEARDTQEDLLRRKVKAELRKRMRAHRNRGSRGGGGEVIWTTTPPTERGYYWVRWDEAYNHTDEIVRVRPKRVRCQDTEELIALVTMSDQQHPLMPKPTLRKDGRWIRA